ncbi:MAG: ABC transporter substrate-binding protein [Oscillospiraceae bacterium]|nr:ABC transporter substrate-binding protein [Oscillospiraceae bacterium]
MKKMRTLALLLAVVLALGLLAGCGDASTGSTTDTGAATSGSGSSGGSAASGSVEAAPAKEGVDSIVVEMINFGYNDPDLQAVENAINAITEEKINVHVHFLTVPIMDMPTKLGLMVAGNEEIDIVATGLLSSPAQFAAQGLLQPLDEYIENSAVLKEKAGAMLEACKVNGKLYAYPGTLYPGTGVALYYDKDVAAELGINMPEHVNDPTELEPCWQAVLDAGSALYPVSLGDGINQEMNFGFVFEDLGDHTSISYGAILDPFNGTTVEDWYESETYEKQIRMIQGWYEAGYTLPDSISNGLSTHATMEAGQCFSFFGPYATGTDEGYWSNTTHHNVGAVHIGDTSISGANVLQTSWGIASTSTKAEAAIRFAELIYSDPEVATLYRYGVEGLDWVKVEGTDHTITYPDGIDSSSVGYGSFIPLFGDELQTPVLSPRDDSFYDVYEAMSIHNAKPFKYLGYSFDPSSVMSQVTAVQAVITKYGPSLNVGVTDVDSMWPKFVSDLKDAGIDDIVAENQRQLDAWLAQQ